MRLLRASGSTKLGKVASCSASQGLWLGDRKVGFHEICEDRNRLPRRGTVEEVRKGGRRSNNRTKETVYRFRFRFGRERRASCLPCLSLGLGDDRRSTSGSGDVSLTIIIASVSCRKSLASFTNRFFHFSGLPDFRMAFDAAERNGKFGRTQCQRSKESSSRKMRKRRVFLCRRTVRIKVKSKVISASFLKIEERGTFIGAKDRKKRDGSRIGRWSETRS